MEEGFHSLSHQIVHGELDLTGCGQVVADPGLWIKWIGLILEQGKTLWSSGVTILIPHAYTFLT